MQQYTHTLEIATKGRYLYSITSQVMRWVESTKLNTGLLNVFVQHTSASLLIQENADPDVQSDLERFFKRLIPDGDSLFQHTTEGPDDMPSHVRSALTQTNLSIPLINGELALGTWQGIYLYEHRVQSHRRSVVLHLLGE